MTDLNKLLREKLEAVRDDFADASTYTIRPGSVISVGAVGNGTVNTIRPVLTPLGEKLEEVQAHIKQLDYILQRIVPNYDELVAQYRAIKDIEEAGK